MMAEGVLLPETGSNRSENNGCHPRAVSSVFFSLYSLFRDRTRSRVSYGCRTEQNDSRIEGNRWFL